VPRGELEDALDGGAWQHGAGGIRGAVEHEDARVAREQLELLEVGLKAGLGREAVANRSPAGEERRHLERRPARIGNEHTVPVLDRRHQRREHGARAAGRHDDPVGLRVDPVPPAKLLGDQGAKRSVSARQRVLDVAVAQRLLHRLDDVRGGREVRLADLEVDDVLERRREVHHLPDPRAAGQMVDWSRDHGYVGLP